MTDIAVRLHTALADRYRVERELGQGGMATVYLAHELKHDRDVAIKVLHPDLGAALGGDRFLSEIRTTARLQHPHILGLLDSGAADGLLFYVMPYVRGETLRARLERETQLPVSDALSIAIAIADALGEAHAVGIVHRDIRALTRHAAVHGPRAGDGRQDRRCARRHLRRWCGAVRNAGRRTTIYGRQRAGDRGQAAH